MADFGDGIDNHSGADSDLLRLIDMEISSSICFETDQTIDGVTGVTLRDREHALDYYRGIMRDLPAQDGWSKVVSCDVADQIGKILPGLLRVFAGAGQIAVYQPAKPGDEPFAAQATDYINYIWESECEGYHKLFAALHDALLVRNGILKCYWDETPEYDTEDLYGLTDDQLGLLMQDQGVEIIGYGSREELLNDPGTGQTVPLQLHDLRIRRVSSSGKLCIEVVPPEDFGVASNTTLIDKSRFVWHRTRQTRSDLIAAGYDRQAVEDIPPYGQNPAERVYRDERVSGLPNEAAERALDELEVYECYPLHDQNGDGIAERLKVVVAGGKGGGRRVLSVDPWPEGDLPFVDLTPIPVPHRWMGESIADLIMPLQKVKTAVWRQMLDNLYLANRPQRVVNNSALVNPDEVLNPKIGGVIRIKQGTVGDAIRDLVAPFIGDKALIGIQYLDGVIESRTGISNKSAALDPTALDPQTATAEQIQHDASYAQIELIARNIAEMGLKRLFRKLLRIIVRHQDRPRTIRLRGEWVNMDPRAWNSAMDVNINVGLGTGSRERDLNMLGMIAKQQDQVVGELGPDNPIVPPAMWVKTRLKMVETAGLRGSDQYFKPISDDDFRQWRQANPPPPNPHIQVAQMKAEALAQESVQRLQLDQQKAAADAQTKQAKVQADAQAKQGKVSIDAQLAQLKAQMDLEVRQMEMELEARLKREQMALDHHADQVTSIARPN